MIQRTLYTVIRTGLSAFKANPALYTNLFGTQWGLAPGEIAGIVKFFATKTVSVKHGYALADFAPPQVTILMQSEAQSDMLLGDYVGQRAFMGADDMAMQAANLGSFWEASYQILCFTENADATTFLYEIIKAILVASKPAFAAADIESPMLSGNDVAPDNRFQPEHLFVRALNFRCKTRFVVTDYNNALAAALKIEGLSIPNVSQYPNGGIRTLVTPTQTKGKAQ